MYIYILGAVSILQFSPAAATSGSALCPCLVVLPDGLPRDNATNELIYEGLGGGQYHFPEDYGLGCMAHDANLDPYCGTSSDSPTWCSETWCYVDASGCDERYQMSAYFPEASRLAFSYATCGQRADFGSSVNDEDYFGYVLNEAQRYMRASRNSIEEAVREDGLSSGISCPLSSSFCAACPDCISRPLWGGVGVLYEDVGFWLNQVQLVGEAAAREAAATCMSSMMRGAYSKVAAAEGNPTRVGFQYFADQFTGSYTQMPHTDWCPSSAYDPRLRPWYAAGATAPKDVVIVVDASGSMYSGIGSASLTRSDAAYAATLALLDTLSWADYFNVVLFSDFARAAFDSTTAASEDNKAAARDFMNGENWASGSTNFKDAFERAIGTLRDGRDSGSTSTCNRIILFLSDGAPNQWSEDDFTWLGQEASNLGAVIFTYGLSSAADATISKRIACENKGIYYQIDDSVAEQGLAAAMTSYYSYFAAGQTKCEASYLRYTDAVSGELLYGMCLPVKNLPDSEPKVLGVTCMDLDLLVNMESALQNGYADELICQMSAQTKKCLPLDFDDCSLEKLRASTDYAERCDESISITSCGCVDPSCTDNPLFVDELDYYCDSWVGDNCEQGQEIYGYSASGMQAVFSNCPRSCGTCQYISDEATCNEDHCGATELPSECRACNGIIPGQDLWERPLLCPGATTTEAPSVGGDDGGGGDSGGDDDGGDDGMLGIIVPISIVITLLGVAGTLFRMRSRLCSRASGAAGPAGGAPPIVVATPVTVSAGQEPTIVGQVV